MKSKHLDFFSREELLGGLPAKRANTVIFALENRTAQLVTQLQLTPDATEEASTKNEWAFIEALAQGREFSPPITIQDLEHHASQWVSLIPKDPGIQAAIAYLLEEKYTFNYRTVPNTRSALGLDRDVVQTHYRRYHMIAEESYKNIMRLLPILTVDVLPFNENFSKVLLFKRVNKPAKDEYFSPGGRLLKNEKLLDGACRQCQREFGLKVKKEKLLPGGVIEEIWEDSVFEGVNYHCVTIFFGYSLSSAQFANLTLDEQHNECLWFDIDEPAIHPGVKYRIETILSRRSSQYHENFGGAE